MDLFGLINEDVKKAWNKKNEKELNAAKTQYLKSMYKKATEYDVLHEDGTILLMKEGEPF